MLELALSWSLLLVASWGFFQPSGKPFLNKEPLESAHFTFGAPVPMTHGSAQAHAAAHPVLSIATARSRSLLPRPPACTALLSQRISASVPLHASPPQLQSASCALVVRSNCSELLHRVSLPMAAGQKRCSPPA